MTKDKPAIGGNIKRQRQSKGLTLSELARRAGIAKGLLSSIENGADTTTTTARKIAIQLGVSLDALIDERTVTGYIRGHKCYFNQSTQQWHYYDNDVPFDDSRKCPQCDKMPTSEGYDACLGHIPGVHSACCGHGVKDGSIVWEDETR